MILKGTAGGSPLRPQHDGPAEPGHGQPWGLLALPLFFLAHIGEELFAGEGFAAWTGRLFGSPLSIERYAAINLFGWPLFLLLSILAITKPRLRWLAAMLSTLLVANAGLHGLGTLVARATHPASLPRSCSTPFLAQRHCVSLAELNQAPSPRDCSGIRTARLCTDRRLRLRVAPSAPSRLPNCR